MTNTVLRSIRGVGFKNLDHKYELTSADLFIGPNGAGKTRLIDLIRLLMIGKPPKLEDLIPQTEAGVWMMSRAGVEEASVVGEFERGGKRCIIKRTWRLDTKADGTSSVRCEVDAKALGVKGGSVRDHQAALKLHLGAFEYAWDPLAWFRLPEGERRQALIDMAGGSVGEPAAWYPADLPDFAKQPDPMSPGDWVLFAQQKVRERISKTEAEVDRLTAILAEHQQGEAAAHKTLVSHLSEERQREVLESRLAHTREARDAKERGETIPPWKNPHQRDTEYIRGDLQEARHKLRAVDARAELERRLSDGLARVEAMRGQLRAEPMDVAAAKAEEKRLETESHAYGRRQMLEEDAKKLRGRVVQIDLDIMNARAAVEAYMASSEKGSARIEECEKEIPELERAASVRVEIRKRKERIDQLTRRALAVRQNVGCVGLETDDAKLAGLKADSLAKLKEYEAARAKHAELSGMIQAIRGMMESPAAGGLCKECRAKLSFDDGVASEAVQRQFAVVATIEKEYEAANTLLARHEVASVAAKDEAAAAQLQAEVDALGPMPVDPKDQATELRAEVARLRREVSAFDRDAASAHGRISMREEERAGEVGRLANLEAQIEALPNDPEVSGKWLEAMAWTHACEADAAVRAEVSSLEAELDMLRADIKNRPVFDGAAVQMEIDRLESELGSAALVEKAAVDIAATAAALHAEEVEVKVYRNMLGRLANIEREITRKSVGELERRLSDTAGSVVRVNLRNAQGKPVCQITREGVPFQVLSDGELIVALGAMLYTLADGASHEWRPILRDRIESVSIDRRTPFLEKMVAAVKAGTISQFIGAGCPDTVVEVPGLTIHRM